MIVRNVEPDDIYTVIDLEYQNFEYPYPPEIINFLFESYRDTFLVVEKDMDIIGFVIGIIQKKEGHILVIAIRDDYKRRGIGTILMKKLIEVYQKKGITKLKLEVRISNVAAISMYKNLGFKITNRLKHYYENGEDGLLLRRDKI
ncbi:MAG: putative N-acetyltransferase [Candidatus Methanofastidiosum methylothiophilum]|uniref:Putative N-acetyltransferase n=1 Tax=Candidatus Methanofastidiosum methylothiophilum TaxID=1705564 RepID=A0A150IRC0_9EURY|nr:MAG: putative N-acetyltransferase [Candidatus Methanofastidiosum methylthiophilus]KYC47418.1 MAG: putative N-acetyltransferase [Candidatus Methanofastidiosum methylthiophilus]KYC49602.1 MAG: putative N-acetyltransferase [Candidatus Methanofastidiosum methylthiophilus]